MINRICCAFLIFGFLASTLAVAESKFPIDKPVGGEPFGHSVTEIGDGPKEHPE